MMNTPQQGPTVPTVYKREYDIQRIKMLDKVVARLHDWRNADHEDAKVLCRNEIIDIIEGVNALRRLSQ